ncbi:hypothetical protein J4526_09170 [Desulfurococcaceae archaeon MEX13E-LK6-19]|nr:hypothetical protein J4526_09170 [Desulfurococcaceae archaeon MEX13E-LK6-19]
MELRVLITPEEISITGIDTHIKSYTILYNLRDYIETKNRRLLVSFEGGPGPAGEGMCIKISIKGEPLSRTDLNAIKKFFELQGANVTVKDFD